MRKHFTLLILLIVLMTGYASAQERVITGKVTSAEDGAPVSGVSVLCTLSAN